MGAKLKGGEGGVVVFCFDRGRGVVSLVKKTKKQKLDQKKASPSPSITSASSCFRASQIGRDALSDWKRARRLGEGA